MSAAVESRGGRGRGGEGRGEGRGGGRGGPPRESIVAVATKAATKEMGPEPPKPNREETEAKRRRLQDQVENLYKQLEDMTQQANEERKRLREERESEIEKVKDAQPKGEREQAIADMQKLREKQDDLSKRLKERKEEVKKIDDARKEERTRLGDARAGGPPTSLAEIDRAIRELEFQLETSGSGSLKHEKRVQAEIQALKASKDSVKNRDSVQNRLKDLETSRREITEKLEAEWQELTSVRAEREKLQEKLDELTAARRSAMQEVRDKLGGPTASSNPQGAERDAIRERIKKLKTEISEDRTKFGEQMDKWREWDKKRQDIITVKIEEEKKRRDEERAKRDEENKKRDEQRRLEKLDDERVRRINPKSKEIQMCKNTMEWLQTFVRSQRQEKQTVDFDANANAPKTGLVVLNKTANDDEWLFGDRRKKKEPKPAAKAAPKNTTVPQDTKGKRIGNIPVQQMQAFDRVGVRPPLFVGEIAETIKLLAEKQKEFEALKRSEAEVNAEILKEEEERKARGEASDEEEGSPRRGGRGGYGRASQMGRGRSTEGGDSTQAEEGEKAAEAAE